MNLHGNTTAKEFTFKAIIENLLNQLKWTGTTVSTRNTPTAMDLGTHQARLTFVIMLSALRINTIPVFNICAFEVFGNISA